MTRVYVIRGGMLGWDGPWTSAGMDSLAAEIAAAVPGVVISVHNWSDYATIEQSIRKLPADSKIALIGYSGGGWKAAEIANTVRPRAIALIVALDPSPAFAVARETLHNNVQHAICYYNTSPWMLGYGGGLLRGPMVTVKKITEQHLAVQNDANIRSETITAIKQL